MNDKQVTIPLNLLKELRDACGWVKCFYLDIDLENHPDPNAVNYLRDEADSLQKQVDQYIKQVDEE